MALTIDQSVYEQANSYAQQGDVTNAWLTLANAGDSYARQAYAIIAEPDSLYARLVETQWSLHASPEQITQKFDLVAEQHVAQYLDVILDSGEFRLPHTLQIEQSYKQALDDNEISQLAAVDAMFSLLDYQDSAGDVSWGTILEMEPARIIYNSDVWASETFDPTSEIFSTVLGVTARYAGETNTFIAGTLLLLVDGAAILNDLGEFTTQIMGDDPQATAQAHRLLSAIDPSLTTDHINEILDKLSIDTTTFATNNLTPLAILVAELDQMVNGTSSEPNFTSRDEVISASEVLAGGFLSDITLRFQLHDVAADADIAGQDNALGRAYRYGLANLLPFVLVSEDGLSTPIGMNSSEYAIENFTTEYLEDRARFLSVQNTLFTDDEAVLQNAGQNIRFEDIESETVLTTDRPGRGGVGPTRQFIFGGTNDDPITGGVSADRLYGGAGNDTISGGAGNDYIEGNSGEDTLDGGTGVDTMAGGTGDDTYIVDDTGDLIVEENDQGIDNVESSASYSLSDNVENLTLTGTGYTSGTGNELDNQITGSDARNILSGEAGDDILVGAGGKDTLYGGADTDYLYGGSGDDVLNGGSGTNYLIGGADNDTYIIERGSTNTITDNEGTNSLFIDGRPVSVGLDNGDGTWSSQDGELTFTQGADLTITDTFGTSVTIENYQADDFGIKLIDEAADPVIPITTNTFTDEDASYSGPAGNVTGTITGTSGNDDITNTSAIVRGIFGREGNDIIYGGDGGNILHGNNYLPGDLSRYMPSLNDDDIIYGGTGNDRILGVEGDDFLYGGAGNDQILGGLGKDYIEGGIGLDFLQGGPGKDYIFGGEGNDVITGDYSSLTQVVTFGGIEYTSVGDVLYGGQGDDFIVGSYGDDALYGGDDNDVLYGDEYYEGPALIEARGNDYLEGGAGDDQLVGQAQDDVLYGGDGNDFLYGDNQDDFGRELDSTYSGNDYLGGGAGNDNLIGGAGDDVLDGGTGIDLLLGQTGNDILFGGDGNDELQGNNGADTLQGGDGDDVLYGEGRVLYAADSTPISSDDLLDGGAGNDTLFGGEGNDVLIGGDGNDVLDGDVFSLDGAEHGNDFLYGGDGNDDLFGSGGNDSLWGGAGDDNLSGDAGNVDDQYQGDDYLNGGDGNDTLIGGGGDDYLYGESGNDALYGDSNNTDASAQGDDYLDGGDGVDLLVGAGGNDTLIGGDGNDKLDGDAGDVAGEYHGNDSLDGGAGDDYLIGYGGDDILIGGTGDDTLFGDSSSVSQVFHGDDYLEGGAGDDILIGGAGSDILIGGTGNDVLYGDGQAGLTGDDFLYGGAGDDTLFSGSGNDFVDGGDGRDTINSGDGDDILTGGAGDDIFIAGAGSDEIFGGYGDDVIFGGDDDDLIFGGLGKDEISSGKGDDVLSGGDGVDKYKYNIGDGVDIIKDNGSNTLSFGEGIRVDNIRLLLGSLQISIGASGDAIHIENFDPDDPYGTHAIDRFEFADGTVLTYEQLIDLGFDLEGTEGDDVITGTNAVDRLNGFGGNDTLIAKDDDDVLDGGTGADNMSGGAGDDVYIVDDIGDVVVEKVDEGNDRVESSISYTLTDNVENLTLTGNAALEGVGNELDNTLIANDNGSSLQGLAGNDTLVGGIGADVIDGGTGADVMQGGAGDDLYTVADASDQVIEFADQGSDTVNASLSYTLGENLENLNLTGSNSINGTGNSLDNNITGNTANNTLDGGTGADTLTGGAGDDTYVVDNASDTVVENADEGIDLVESSVDYTLTDNVENLTLTYQGVINGTGNAIDNVITGADGNNVLDGGAGADTLIGGAGGDTYIVDNVGDVVVEDLLSGNDRVNSSVTYTLSDNVENLYLTGSDAIDGTGNAIGNILQGNAEANRLSGNEGQDSLSGGAGDDQLYAGTGNDLLNGDAGDDYLDGGDGTDTLNGGTGADVMAGGAGRDTYTVDNIGDRIIENFNEGNDTVYASVTHSLDANVETLVLTGSDAINGTGNDIDNTLLGNNAANVLTGGGGNDYLNGNYGADTMAGGTGNDRYILDNAGDTVIENAGEGVDQVETSITHTLADNVENLILTGSSFADGTGNSEDNIITGNDAQNTLRGEAGNDTVDGAGGNDSLYGGTGDDYLYGGADGSAYGSSGFGYGGSSTNDDYLDGGTGNDTLDGGSGDDILYGREGDDYLYGGDGSSSTGYGGGFSYGGSTSGTNNDFLDGGTGNDTLDGGAGDDILYGGEGDDYLFGGIESGGSNPYGGNAYGGASSGGNDYLSGGAGTDTLDGGSGDDTLYGGEDIDSLQGGTGNDLLDGGTGIDTMSGGAGDDIYYVDGYSETVTIPGEPGSDPGHGGTDPTEENCDCDNKDLFSQVEIDDEDHDNRKGNEGVGNGEDAPPPGHDENYNDGEGTSPGNPGAKQTNHSNDDDSHENHQPGHSMESDDHEGDDHSSENDDDSDSDEDHICVTDTTGGVGGTTGGTEPVTTTIWHTDSVTENSGEGYDRVYSTASFTLSENIEELHLTGNVAIDGTGNSSDNVIMGNDADNRIDGGAGIDRLFGGLGDDTYVIDSLDDEIVEYANEGTDTVESSITYSIEGEANLENLKLIGAEHINGIGNASDNLLTGNDGDNSLFGGAGDDTLTGGLGNDFLLGGEGSDTYVIYSGQGVDVIDDTQGVNSVVFTDGLLFDDVIARQTEVNGQTLVSVRLVDQYGNELTEQGFDFVLNADQSSPISSLTFSDGSQATLDDLFITQETYYGTNKGDQIFSDHNDDTIYAGKGNDLINSGAGHDMLFGEQGNDILFAAAGNDQLFGGKGKDTLYGSFGIDALHGGEGNDELFGGSGNDFLIGDGGKDELVGGSGADILAGGLGDDEYEIGCGNDIIMYNKGDGDDEVEFNDTGHESNLTLSLGGGIGLNDLSLSRDDGDLVLIISGEEPDSGEGHQKDSDHNDEHDDDESQRIVIEDWYGGEGESPVSAEVTLQIIMEASDEFDVTSSDPLRNQSIQSFDFREIVRQFDLVAANDPDDNHWGVTNALLDAHLGGSDDAVLGGDIAYRYGMGSSAAIGTPSAAVDTLSDSRFGSQAQPFTREGENQ